MKQMFNLLVFYIICFFPVFCFLEIVTLSPGTLLAVFDYFVTFYWPNNQLKGHKDRHNIFLSLGLLEMNGLLIYCRVHRIPYILLRGFCSFYRFAPGSDGSSAVCLHTFEHGVAEGLLEAAGECSTAMDGGCAHRAGTSCQSVRWLQLHSVFTAVFSLLTV